jgi:hypothetical protein
MTLKEEIAMKTKLTIAAALVALLFGAQAASAQTAAQTYEQQQQSVGALPGTGAPSTFGSGANSYVTSEPGSTMDGAGAMLSGAGQYNLNTAIGARYLEDARARYIQSCRDAIDARYAIKRANELYRSEKFAKERMSPELLGRVIQAKLPDRLNAAEYNPRTGALKWPAVLTGPEFSADRQTIEQAFAQRRGEDVGVTSIFYRQVSQHAQNMHEKMMSEIDRLPTADSVAARKFLKSIEFEARHLPEATGLAINGR